MMRSLPISRTSRSASPIPITVPWIVCPSQSTRTSAGIGCAHRNHHRVARQEHAQVATGGAIRLAVSGRGLRVASVLADLNTTSRRQLPANSRSMLCNDCLA